MGDLVLNTTVLDVAIGLVFVYLLLSLVCKALLEIIAAIFNLRYMVICLHTRRLGFSCGHGHSGVTKLEVTTPSSEGLTAHVNEIRRRAGTGHI
jgi:hypothetical protein